jgi:small subunit ribosomal protein S20
MPNIKSASKRVLISKARNASNRAAKSLIKTNIKKFDAAASGENRDEALSAYKTAVKTVDRAAARGLIHKNNAAHKKSALTAKLNGIQQ